MKKWKIEIGIVVLVIVIGFGIWWFIAIKNSRLATAQYNQLLKYAQRQAIEIAIIEQASKLENYKQQIEKNKKIEPTVIPKTTIVADPIDVNDDK